MKTMKLLLLFLGCVLTRACLAQSGDPAIEFEMEPKDAARIWEMSTRIMQINQDFLNNSAAAFDAVFSRLDGVKVESEELENPLSFSFSKILDQVIDKSIGVATSMVPGGKYGASLLKDIYNVEKANQEKLIRIQDAKAVNTMKHIMAGFAESRTATFTLNRSAIEKPLVTAFKRDGGAFLTKAEEGLSAIEASLERTHGNNKIQTLIFEFQMLKELITGMSRAYKNNEFMLCEVWLTGCTKSGWETSLNTPTASCPSIKKARFTFAGDLSQQFVSAANAVLTPFLMMEDEKARFYLADLDVNFHMKIHAPDCSDDCSIIVPVSRHARKLSVIGNTSWRNCSSDGIYLMALDQAGKLTPLLRPVVDRLATAKAVKFDEIFYEDAKIRP